MAYSRATHRRRRQMDDEQGPDERPRLFRSMTACVGGATGVVIALGGLAAAYRQLMPQSPVEAAARNDNEAAPAAAPADAHAAAAASVPADDPWYYTTDDGGTLRWVGGLWVETSPTGAKTRYTHQSTGDGTTVAV